MVNLFTTVVYMSILSSFVVLCIILIRGLIGNKLPKIFSYALWAVLLFRLLIPVSFPSMVSLFNLYPVLPHSHKVGASDIAILDKSNAVQSGLENRQTSDALNHVTRDISSMIDQRHLSILWLCITVGLMMGCIIIYRITIRPFKEAIICRDINLLGGKIEEVIVKRKVSIYSLKGLSTPVVYGILKPKIIIPSELVEAGNDTVLKNVIRHEVIHLWRFDYLIKLVSIGAVCIHWFNPIIWVALVLAHKDMEKACDEGVIQLSQEDIRQEYASSLLSFSLDENNIGHVGLVAFGESNIKQRIKGIVGYKKIGFWKKSMGVVVLLLVGILLISDASTQKDVSKQTKLVDIGFKNIMEQIEGEWTPLAAVSPYIIKATIASEDKNYYKHKGADWSKIAAAMVSNIKQGSMSQGGTTITQNVVRQIVVYESNGLSTKRKQIDDAIRLEKNHSKDDILEAYLNITSFGNGTQGIGDASRFYFGKEPGEVSLEEAASLIAIIQAPTRYNPIERKENNEQRAAYIIEEMRKIE